MIVYKIVNTQNNKVYIGQSVNDSSRWVEHRSELNRGVHGNEHLQSAWKKYGEMSFQFEVLHECNSQIELNEKEIHFISEYNSLDRTHGYNLRAGGNDYTHSEETRQKMSRLKTGFHHSEETKRKISKNNARNMLGKHPSEETRQKISDAGRGRIKSPETIAKLKATLATSTNPHHLAGAKKSKEQCKSAADGLRKKWSDPTFRSRMITARQKQMTPELKQKISSTQKQRMKVMGHNQAKLWPPFVDPTGNVHTEIKDMSKFARIHELDDNKMRLVAHNKNQSHKGWKLAPKEAL